MISFLFDIMIIILVNILIFSITFYVLYKLDIRILNMSKEEIKKGFRDLDIVKVLQKKMLKDKKVKNTHVFFGSEVLQQEIADDKEFEIITKINIFNNYSKNSSGFFVVTPIKIKENLKVKELNYNQIMKEMIDDIEELAKQESKSLFLFKVDIDYLNKAKYSKQLVEKMEDLCYV